MSDWAVLVDGFWSALAGQDTADARLDAERSLKLAFVGAPACGKTSLACALAGLSVGDGLPEHLSQYVIESTLPLRAGKLRLLEQASAIVLVLDATKGDYVQEVAAADYLTYLGQPMLVCYNKIDLLPPEIRLIRGESRWRGAEILPLSAVQPATVQQHLVPALVDVLAERSTALARHFPAFRRSVVDHFVEKQAALNASRATATGLSEGISHLRLPLSTAELEELAVRLAMMVYRIGLMCGLPQDWSTTPASEGESAVLLQTWQHLEQRVRGIIPLWSLEDKVRLVQAGTHLTARAFEAWIVQQRVPSGDELNKWSHEAVDRAKPVAVDLIAKAREAMPAQPPTPKTREHHRVTVRGLRFLTRKVATCPACGAKNRRDATTCSACGQALTRGDPENT